MKKLFAIILSVCFVASLATTTAFAGGVSTSTRSLSIKKGGNSSFTITASNAAGRVDVSSSNSAVAQVNKSSAWLDKSSTTISVSGIKDGSATIYVRISDVSGYDGKKISGTIAISVSVYTPVYVKSSVSTLSSISIPDIKFEEDFSPSRKEYTAYLPNDMKSPKISVSTSHSLASVSSINNNLQEGWNEVKISCTAEDGKTKSTYTLKLYVEETPTEIVKYKGVDLGIVKNLDKVNLEGFEKVDGLFVCNGYKLQYLMNMKTKEKGFYVVENDSIVAKYTPVEIGEESYIPFDASYDDYKLNGLLVEKSVEFAGEQIAGWSYSDESLANYCVVELLNENGEKELFTFDKENNTLQKYFELPVDNSMDIYKTATYGLAGFSALLLVLLIVVKIPKKIKH